MSVCLVRGKQIRLDSTRLCVLTKCGNTLSQHKVGRLGIFTIPPVVQEDCARVVISRLFKGCSRCRQAGFASTNVIGTSQHLGKGSNNRAFICYHASRWILILLVCILYPGLQLLDQYLLCNTMGGDDRPAFPKTILAMAISHVA